ncbi:hypothetical protein JMG10_28150 [Nostoc ellipsosporum NOK]|nr:hypothetical protein [Nostoc ellipsosporum NOK]
MKLSMLVKVKQNGLFFSWILLLLFAFTMQPGFAQLPGNEGGPTNLPGVQAKYGLDPATPLLKRVSKTPDHILERFKEAGMSPTEHVLTTEEISIVDSAIARLPPLHKRVLRQHLKSFSFLDNMPNTALTSPVTGDEMIKLYHITFRAGLLHQTISEWMSQKENSLFVQGDSTITLSIQAGLLNAMNYILLHEGTHVVDGSLGLLAIDTAAGRLHLNSFTTNFSKGIWKDMSTHEWFFTDSLVTRNRFRPDGRPFQPAEAVDVYEALIRTPFASFYSTASWHEDLAELVTLYHLTQKCGQPFRIIVSANGKEIAGFEPMESRFVKRRFRILRRFYR